ncbi:MAG: uroporphyrinogen-III C-methyltransferase [bacterium]
MADGGKVYLIGAGPGDPELITVRGQHLLAECQVVVYDNLVPTELIVRLPATTRKIYVGKQAGQHALEQDQINQLLVDLARQGKTVARLKGADPLIFGRGSEEAAFLKKNGIPFEIVPGVTAASGAAAYAGIPCTDREKASFVVFATGHKAGEKDTTSVPWDWLGQAKKGTIVVYMGVSEVAEYVSRLIEGGLSPRTPAAVVERATMPTQRRFTGVLEDLPRLVTDHAVRAPALFIIGEVVTLVDKIDWFGGRPLSGKRVMVLRPADQAAEVYSLLRQSGAEVLPYPTIATRGIVDHQAWERFETFASTDGWLVFTSENGVRYFMSRLVSGAFDIRALARFRIAAVGVGTARSLSKYHLSPDFLPQKATVAQLARELADRHNMTGKTIVRVEGNLSDNTVPEILADAGGTVIRMPVYETYYPTWSDDLKAKLLKAPPGAILFSSGSTAVGLQEILSADEISIVTSGAIIASIGPSTSQAIRRFGLSVAVEATEHSLPGLVNALIDHYLNCGDQP